MRRQSGSASYHYTAAIRAESWLGIKEAFVHLRNLYSCSALKRQMKKDREDSREPITIVLLILLECFTFFTSFYTLYEYFIKPFTLSNLSLSLSLPSLRQSLIKINVSVQLRR